MLHQIISLLVNWDREELLEAGPISQILIHGEQVEKLVFLIPERFLRFFCPQRHHQSFLQQMAHTVSHFSKTMPHQIFLQIKSMFAILNLLKKVFFVLYVGTMVISQKYAVSHTVGMGLEEDKSVLVFSPPLNFVDLMDDGLLIEFFPWLACSSGDIVDQFALRNCPVGGGLQRTDIDNSLIIFVQDQFLEGDQEVLWGVDICLFGHGKDQLQGV